MILDRNIKPEAGASVDPRALCLRERTNHRLDEHLFAGDPGTDAVNACVCAGDELLILTRSHGTPLFDSGNHPGKVGVRLNLSIPSLPLYEFQFEDESPMFTFDPTVALIFEGAERRPHNGLPALDVQGTLNQCIDKRIYISDGLDAEVELEAWSSLLESPQDADHKAASFWLGLELTAHEDNTHTFKPVLVSHDDTMNAGFLFGSERGRTLGIGLLQVVQSPDEETGVKFTLTAVPLDAMLDDMRRQAEMRRMMETLGRTGQLLGPQGGHA